jgi:hypothetical protein
VLAQWAGGPYDTGSTAGLMNYSTTSPTNPNESNPTANSSGCAFSPFTNARNDLFAMPTTDRFGNALAGPYSTQDPAFPYLNNSAILTSVTSPKQIVIASTNALDNEATTIRTNTVLKPAIYTIALEGDDPNDPPSTLLLRKIANDPSMENDPNPAAQAFFQAQKTQTKGFFADAPDPSQLCAAFNAIATQIVVRL